MTQIIFNLDEADLYVDGEGPLETYGDGGLVLSGEGTTRYGYETLKPYVTEHNPETAGRDATLRLTLDSDDQLLSGKYIHLKVRVGMYIAEIAVTACTPLIELTFPRQVMGDIDTCESVWIERLGDSPQNTYTKDIKLTGISITA